MKKLLTLLLSILVCLSLVGCNKKDNTTNEKVIEPTINEVVEVPNNTIEEEVVVEEVTTTEVKEEVKDNTTLSYWVNFLNKDGSVLQRTVYKYGETPSYKGTTPTYTDYAYYYSFKGWDKQTYPVKGTQTYTALYDIVGEVPSSESNDSEPAIRQPQILKFKAIIAGSTVALNVYGSPNSISMQYKTNSMSDWATYAPGVKDENIPQNDTQQIITLTTANDWVEFRADPNNLNTSFSKGKDDYYYFNLSGCISAYGDVTSLINGIGGDVDLSDTNGKNYDYCFRNLFCGCSVLTTAPALPSTALAQYCYYRMFENCTSLTTVPVLPANKLAIACYGLMFSGCDSLYVSDTKIVGVCEIPWIAPLNGTYINYMSPLNVFTGCKGNRSSDDMTMEIGGTKTYYTQNTPVE